MKRSTLRILTTHTGSLPRPDDLLGLLRAKEEGRLTDRAAFDDCVRRAVAGVVRRQSEAGVDVVNDGEQGKVDYSTYVTDRLTGFDGESIGRRGLDVTEFPEFSARSFTAPFQKRPACTGPIAWKNWPEVEKDIANLKAAVDGVRAEEVFMTSVSPGQKIGRAHV